MIPCPLDRSLFRMSQLIRDTSTHNQIMSFKIKCKNGCDWINQLSNLRVLNYTLNINKFSDNNY